MKDTTMKDFFGEIIESSVDDFTAQTWSWNLVPHYGSLIEVVSNNTVIVGVVAQVHTGSQDPVRKPFTYQKTQAELLREQPQIFAFLKTTFRVQIIGYYEQNVDAKKFLYLLPPQPATLHAFTKECTSERYAAILNDPTYLSMLFAFQTKIVQLDELLLALLRTYSLHNKLLHNDIMHFCNAYSLHTGNDYKRLKLFLQRSSGFLT